MKRKSIILILITTTLVFSGCGSNSNSGANTNTQPNSTTMLSEEDARQIALEQVPGATEVNIVEFRKDPDNTKAEFEGEIHYNGMEYEFEIDAYEGTILEWDEEPIKR
jgi:uncharacterized membrane protein YkoI